LCDHDAQPAIAGRELRERVECGMTVSLWQDTAAWPGEVDHEFVEADVCVIGGGFVGGTLATLLGELGKQVVVVEAQQVGLGTSGRNAGHCIAAFRDNYHR